jgi:hypothetical protein
MIYHYCDAAAFISIVTNKKLWLTNTRKMNDHSEGAIIERAILKWLREDQERNDPPRYADNAASLIEEALAQNRPELYACCFSRERDSTTQWLNYADRGRGFAIGFREDLLHTNTLVPWNHSSFEGEKYVVPVRFSDNASERLTLNAGAVCR